MDNRQRRAMFARLSLAQVRSRQGFELTTPVKRSFKKGKPIFEVTVVGKRDDGSKFSSTRFLVSKDAAQKDAKFSKKFLSTGFVSVKTRQVVRMERS